MWNTTTAMTAIARSPWMSRRNGAPVGLAIVPVVTAPTVGTTNRLLLRSRPGARYESAQSCPQLRVPVPLDGDRKSSSHSHSPQRAKRLKG